MKPQTNQHPIEWMPDRSSDAIDEVVSCTQSGNHDDAVRQDQNLGKRAAMLGHCAAQPHWLSPDHDGRLNCYYRKVAKGLPAYYCYDGL
jgi:hypothetical protein